MNTKPLFNGHNLLKAFTVFLLVSPSATASFGQSAQQLLKEGSRYQAADDISDKAVEYYRQLMKKYPTSSQAESAQFFLGTYYSRKFFILENKNKVQDWETLNRAEKELYAYIGRYQRGSYVADAYQVLAIAALRRGYGNNARTLNQKMKEAGARDKQVYLFRITWSSSSDDVIKGYCNTTSLHAATSQAMDQQSSFGGFVNALTKWAQSNCH